MYICAVHSAFFEIENSQESSHLQLHRVTLRQVVFLVTFRPACQLGRF